MVSKLGSIAGGFGSGVKNTFVPSACSNVPGIGSGDELMRPVNYVDSVDLTSKHFVIYLNNRFVGVEANHFDFEIVLFERFRFDFRLKIQKYQKLFLFILLIGVVLVVYFH